MVLMAELAHESEDLAVHHRTGDHLLEQLGALGGVVDQGDLGAGELVGQSCVEGEHLDAGSE